MTLRTVSIATLAALAMIAAACGPAPAGSTFAVASDAPRTATYDEFSAALCGSFTSLIRAVGNPDTGTGSVVSKTLDDAIARGDVLAADRAAAAMLAELEAGRAQAAAAARWAPGATAMRHMDVLLLAFEASTTAKRAVAATVPGADPQKAFEAAGGVEAWSGMLQAIAAIGVPAGASPPPCRAFSGQL